MNAAALTRDDLVASLLAAGITAEPHQVDELLAALAQPAELPQLPRMVETRAEAAQPTLTDPEIALAAGLAGEPRPPADQSVTRRRLWADQW